MSNANGAIQFRGYKVIHMGYDCPANISEESIGSLQFRIGYGVEPRPDGSMQVNVGVRAFGGKSVSNFDEADLKATVELAGNFMMMDGAEWDEKWNANAIAILIPYARAILSAITVQAGRPPIILPTVNTNKLVNPDKEEEK